MAKKKTESKTANVPIKANKHVTDSRTNIPTRELAEFAVEDGIGKAIYSRDRSLDPQLVWKGKDEQDAKGNFVVPAVPIYVQEKIHPRAIIDDLRAHIAASKPADNLFADFNGLDDFQKKLEFYQHDQHWSNRFILGDSLLVMASLAEKERLRGKVQCIYFDPPYGIKFGSNWQVSTRKRDVKDAKSEDLTRQPEQIKAFRDTWELGIHSYLTYIRDRLAAARELLTQSGSVFVQISDENLHLVRCLLDEIFGSENFIGLIPFRKKTMPFGTSFIEQMSDFIIWYGKNREAANGISTKYRKLFRCEPASPDNDWSWYELPGGKRCKMTRAQIDNSEPLPANARIYRLKSLEPSGTNKSGQFEFKYQEKVYSPPRGGWGTDEPSMTNLARLNRLQPKGELLNYTLFFDDYPVSPLTAPWNDTVGPQDKRYVVQTNDVVVQRCILMTTDPGDLVLDPTCGSGTTAYVAEQWGRRWITIDTSRVALALARTRLMTSRFPYYLLTDSYEGRRKLAERDGKANDPTAPNPQLDIHKGFVYKTVPHIKLNSIANNLDIKDGMSREQIDAAIARHAETETLFDQPYEEKGVVRLTGPFTVESLSPHKALPMIETTESACATTCTLENYLATIIDNLRKSGVKGTSKAQRINFSRLDSFAGEYIQAEGETTENAAVRVSIGPETGTVGDAWIKAAAIEAIKGSKCELLLVCAFAFEASVHEQTAELTKEVKFGKLRILPVRMNPDLAMFGDETGKELLKKTGAGNLFTVFGEPDLKIEQDKSGKVKVTIRGLDVFDPTTGEVRTGGTDDIACWFIDTDYNGESFFVRHAYFLGADEPYEKLKKALRAEIDEAEWSKLYSATSLPFDPPTTGKIAVKVINHFGDEVLKVYPVSGKNGTEKKKAK